MICRIDASGYCSDCNRKHYGHTLAISQEESDYAESIRQVWRGNKPSTTRRIVNFAKAVGKQVVSGKKLKVSLEVTESNVKICKACDLYDKNLDRCNHTKCGCTIQAKASWSTSKCPLVKWSNE